MRISSTLSEGSGKSTVPFASYEEALNTWRTRTEKTRSQATTRYSVVVTAARR